MPYSPTSRNLCCNQEIRVSPDRSYRRYGSRLSESYLFLNYVNQADTRIAIDLCHYRGALKGVRVLRYYRLIH